MKKNMISFTLGCFFAFCVQGAEFPATVMQTKPYLFPHLEFVTGYSISNGSWDYNVSVQRTKNTGKRPAFVQFGCGYPVPALPGLTVNGIKSRNIFLDKDSLKRWEDKESGSAGCEMTLNFDGAKILYRVFMKKNSNLLFIRIAPDSSSVEPIAGIEFSTYACINLDKDPKKRWKPASYAREAVTPQRTLKGNAGNKGVELEPAENTLILRDAAFGKNPVYMAFESAPVQKAVLLNGAYQILNLTLKPDFKEFTYAFWMSPKKQFTNAEFEALLKASPELFKF